MENADARTSTPPIFRIGHRGAAGHAPENTLAAIRQGISLGVDFIELDVQRTRDSRLVILHDEFLDRTTNGTGPIAGLTADELQLLDAGEGERIPTLEAALAAANGHAGMMLEIKAPDIGPDLYRAVHASAFPGPAIYASFLHAEILAIRALDPLAKTLALMECIPVSGAAFALDAGATHVRPGVRICHRGVHRHAARRRPRSLPLHRQPTSTDSRRHRSRRRWHHLRLPRPHSAIPSGKLRAAVNRRRCARGYICCGTYPSGRTPPSTLGNPSCADTAGQAVSSSS